MLLIRSFLHSIIIIIIIILNISFFVLILGTIHIVLYLALFFSYILLFVLLEYYSWPQGQLWPNKIYQSKILAQI